MSSELSHVDEHGRAAMVDVADKPVTDRAATASARLTMKPETLRAIVDNATKKGDVLAVARVAGIQAAKRTPELIPLCHGIALTSVSIAFETDLESGQLLVSATAHARDRTGVEMEALTAASIAALTIYDMVKAIDRGMIVEHIQLESKSGGRSGDWTRPL